MTSEAFAPYALEVVTKATLLLLIFSAGATLLSRASAAAQHLVTTLTMAALLLLPVLTAIAPRWRALPVWTEPARAAGLTVPQAPAPRLSAALPSERPDFALLPDRAGGAAGARRPIGPVPVIAGVYLIGVAAVVGWLVLGGLHVRSLRRSGRPLELPAHPSLLRELAARLGLPRPPLVLESARPLGPMSWGLLRPVVLLPAGASGWPMERLRLVLLHELAHVRRRDGALKVLAGLVLALFWFHPLVWALVRRATAASERASDDLVLAVANASPSAYAGELLSLASTFPAAPRRVTVLATSMARSSELERRLLAVLDGGRRRTPPDRVATIISTVVAAACVLVTASLKAAPGGRPPAPQRYTVKPPEPSMFPAVVVATVPAAGSRSVASTLSEIRVTFSKPMMEGSYSFVKVPPAAFPEGESPRLSDDRRTYSLPVRLEPNRRYAVGINTPPFDNFVDEDRRSAVPYLIEFETGP